MKFIVLWKAIALRSSLAFIFDDDGCTILQFCNRGTRRQTPETDLRVLSYDFFVSLKNHFIHCTSLIFSFLRGTFLCISFFVPQPNVDCLILPRDGFIKTSFFVPPSNGFIPNVARLQTTASWPKSSSTKGHLIGDGECCEYVRPRDLL